jgi:hypothetical protein
MAAIIYGHSKMRMEKRVDACPWLLARTVPSKARLTDVDGNVVLSAKSRTNKSTLGAAGDAWKEK